MTVTETYETFRQWLNDSDIISLTGPGAPQNIQQSLDACSMLFLRHIHDLPRLQFQYSHNPNMYGMLCQRFPTGPKKRTFVLSSENLRKDSYLYRTCDAITHIRFQEPLKKPLQIHVLCPGYPILSRIEVVAVGCSTYRLLHPIPAVAWPFTSLQIHGLPATATVHGVFFSVPIRAYWALEVNPYVPLCIVKWSETDEFFFARCNCHRAERNYHFFAVLPIPAYLDRKLFSKIQNGDI